MQKAFPVYDEVAFASSDLESFHPVGGVPQEERGWDCPRSRG